MITEIKNARIESTMLGYEDHGLMTFWFRLDYGGTGQGFGGIRLDGNGGIASDVCSTAIAQILQTLEVDSWEALKGQLIRVKATDTQVHAIGHILKDKWFCPADVFKTAWGKK